MTNLPLTARTILRAPGFAFGVVVTLALGIAASTFMFTVVYGVLLRPLPFVDEARLVALANTIPSAGVGGFPFSLPEYVEHRDHNKAFAALGAYAQTNVTVMNGAAPERVAAARVTANFFDLMGVHAVIGRTFEPGDGVTGAGCAVVLRHAYWQTRLGGERDVLGRSLTIDDQSCRVLGVAPAEFRWPATADLWLAQAVPAAPPPTMLGRQAYRAVARLAAGVTQDQALGETRALAGRFYGRHPGFYNGGAWEITLTPLRDQVLGSVSTMLVVLAGAVALMFAIACGNVTQLMLSRMLSRDREFAIRLSLGARRWHVLSQLGTECAVLGLAGGALGLWLASAGVDAFLAAESIDLPRRESIGIDVMVLAFALAATVIGIVTMALPAAVRMRGLSVNVSAHTRFGPSTATRRLREGLVSLQVALTVILVVGAALFMASLQRLTHVAPGFDTRDRVVAQVSPPALRYPDAVRSSALFTDIISRVSALPGVTAVGAVSALPLSGQDPRASFGIDGWSPEQAARATEVHYRYVAGDYFRAMGMRLAHGRWPAAVDGRLAPPIAIVNQSFATRFWSAAADAVGQRVSIDGGTTWHTIAGVMVDIKHLGLDAGDQLELFLPYEQASGPPVASMTLVMHTAVPTESMAAAVRDAIAQADSRLPIHAVRTMENVLASSVARPRLRMLTTALFASIGLVLAAVGTFCVMAQFVGERRYEIAVRRALGAQASAIASLVFTRALFVLGAGGVVGIAGAVALSGTVRALLFGVDATEPTAYLSAAAALTLMGVTASALPLWRAVRVSPIAQLRAD
jgi:putative ABC transport system permease protein